jgi:hypothetical protein
MDAAFAAPYSGFPSLLTAFASHPESLAVSMHFLIDASLAAPYSGLPSLLSAFASHAAWLAKAIGLTEKLRAIDKAMNTFFMKLS